MATRKYTTDPNDGFFDEDSMPCLCDCGNWFELNEGYPSKHCNVIVCEECHRNEEVEDEQ